MTHASRPIHVFFAEQRASVGAHVTDESTQYCRETPARKLDEGIPVVEAYALHQRTGVPAKMRVTS